MIHDGDTRAMRSFLLDLRYRAEYLGLRLLAGLVRIAPLDVAVNVSAKIWRLIAPYDRRHQRALENLAIAFPEKTLAEREAIALRHVGKPRPRDGRDHADRPHHRRAGSHPADRSTATVFERYRNKMGAAIGVTLHMGNWELAAWPLTVAGNNPAAVYRTVKNPYVDSYLRALRKDLYPGGLLGKGRINGSIEEGQKTARLIMDFVRQGGRLGLVCDLHDRTGLPVPFFGRPARSVTIPAMIARRVGARIWMARCLRVGKQSRFTIELKELKVPRTANACRRREVDHGGHAGAVRGLDARGPRAMDVEQPALGLTAALLSTAGHV